MRRAGAVVLGGVVARFVAFVMLVVRRRKLFLFVFLALFRVWIVVLGGGVRDHVRRRWLYV